VRTLVNPLSAIQDTAAPRECIRKVVGEERRAKLRFAVVGRSQVLDLRDSVGPRRRRFEGMIADAPVNWITWGPDGALRFGNGLGSGAASLV
jgi:hypothetical protein